MKALPEDEPATVTLRLTVGKSGKVRDKKTVVASNHACYVGQPFAAATKGLTILCALLNGVRRDTVIDVTIGLVYTLAEAKHEIAAARLNGIIDSINC